MDNKLDNLHLSEENFDSNYNDLLQKIGKEQNLLVNLVKHFQDKDEKSYKVFEYDLDNKTVKFGDTIVQDDKEFLKVLKNLHFETNEFYS